MPDIPALTKENVVKEKKPSSGIPSLSPENVVKPPIYDEIMNKLDPLPDAEEAKKKVIDSLILAQVFNKKPSEIYGTHDQVIEQIKQKSETDKIKLGPLGIFWESLLQGMVEKPAMMLEGTTAFTPGEMLGLDPKLKKVSDTLQGLYDPEKREELQRIATGPLWPSKEGEPFYKIDREKVPDVINTWAAQIGDQVPILLITLGSQQTFKWIGRLISSSTGPAAVVIGPSLEIVMKHIGGAAPLIAMEAGYFLDQADEMGIDQDIADKWARRYGLGSGTIEYAQTAWQLKGFSKFTKKIQDKIVLRILREIGGNAFEGVEEFSQQALENFFLNKAVEEMHERNPEFEGEERKVLEGGGRAFLVGAGVSTITRGFGRFSVGVFNKLNDKEKIQVENAGLKPTEEQLRKEAERQFRETQKIEVPEKLTGITPVKEKPGVKISEEKPEITSVEKPEVAPVAEEEKKVERVGRYFEERMELADKIEDVKLRNEVQMGRVAIKDIITKEAVTKEAKALREERIAEFKTTKEKNIINYLEDLGGINVRFFAKTEEIADIPAWVKNRVFTDDDFAMDLDEAADELGMTDTELIQELKKQEKPVAPSKTVKAYEEEALRNIVRDFQEGKISEEEYIEKSKAIGVSEKKIEEAGRKGLALGKKVGRRERMAKERESREKRMVRNYIRKLATRISKPPAKNIDFFYREAIDILQSGIDPYFRTERTLEQRKRLKDFLERHPEKTEDIPVKLLKKIDQTPLNELTIADLEEIADEINNLRKQGRLKYQLKKNQEDRQFQKDRDELVNAILAGETPKEVEGIGRVGRREGFGKKVGRGIQAWTLRPARIFDMLDGGKNFKGKIHNYFLNKVNDFVDEEYIQTDKRREFLKKKAEELGLNIKELSKTIKIGEMKYSYDEVIDLYAGMKNKMKKLAIIWGEDLSEENTQKFIDKLPDELKAWGDTIIDEYNRNHTRLRNAHIKHKNEDMGHEDYYTPIRRYDIDFQEYSAELADSILHREGLRKAYASRGFTIARKDIPKEFQKPLKLGITSIWQDQVQKQEHYIQGADTIKKLQRMSHDPVFASAVEQKYGREIVKSIQEYVNRVANPNIYKAFNTIENISRTARKHVAISYLAYNLVTMGKQLPSVMFYLPYSGPAHLLGSALKFTMHPFKTVRMVNEFAPQIKHRTFERFSEELKQSSRSTYEKIIDKVGKTGMQGIYFMDKVAVSIGWQAVYDKAVAEGKSIQEASQEATNATMRTQPAAHPKDIARLYATNEGLNWLLQFSNQLNQIWNMFTYDLPVQFTRGQISTAFLTMSGLAVSAGMIWMLSHRRIPRDKEDLRDVFLDQFLNSIPIIGRAIASARRGWYSFDIPPLRGAGALGKAIRDIEAGDIKSSTLIKLIEAISVALGLPYIGPKRGIEAIKEGDIKELIGGEPWETGRKKESPVRPKIGSSGGSKGKSSPVTPKI